MRAGGAGRIQAAQLYAAAHADQLTAVQTVRDAADAARSLGMGQHAGTGLPHQRGVAAGVVAMFMGVEDLADGPAHLLRTAQACQLSGSIARASPVSPQATR